MVRGIRIKSIESEIGSSVWRESKERIVSGDIIIVEEKNEILM